MFSYVDDQAPRKFPSMFYAMNEIEEISINAY